MRGTVALRKDGSTFFDGRAAWEERFMRERMNEPGAVVKNDSS